ncbi:uncharacterized protein LOC133350188 [Lethenteron reissneri]|uniref:uncharacterized protein LOC133350188 n=1 Tax=Lethenteron reissneri TaxID=7753 RepID=UPI002AB7030B|nr:uncharacterized protein LOC133350188 [Lethenteron reissneri]
MGTARVAQLGVAAALLLSLLAARAAPLPVASSVPSSSSPSSSSSTSSEPCISADLHKVIRGNMGLLQFNADRVLRAFKGMADVEISEHVAVLSAAEPCVRRAEAVPSPSHLSGAFALYSALIATLCERAHLPDGSEVRVVCRAVVALLEDTPFPPPRSGEEQGDVEAAAAEVTTAVGRKEGEQQQQTENKTVKAQSGGESANDSVVVATEAPGVGNRTETAAAWVAGTSAASTAPTLNHLRGEQYTEAGIADVRNVTATSEEEQWRRTNHHQQQRRRRPQADDKHSEVEKHRKEEVEKEEADEKSQSRWPCLPSHVKHATSLHGSSDSRIVMFALFQRFQQFLTEVSKRLYVCRP